MRIISGKYKGTKLEGFNIEGTRPTMDRVKESLIAIIQNKIKNSVCLDLFAGSGSIGLELLSNGCNKCYFVDNNKIVIDTLNNNINKLKITEVEIIKNDFKDALKSFHHHQKKFDIIFLDPPYQNNYINTCLNLIYKYELLSEEGIIICEYEKEIIINDNFKIIKEKKYGSKNIKILKK